MNFATGQALRTLFTAYEKAQGEFPQFSTKALRALFAGVFPLLPGFASGQKTQNAGTNITIADPGFVPKVVVVYNVTAGKFVVWFSTLGAGKGVDLYAGGDGSAGAIAANGVTVNATTNVTTLGSAIGANAAVLHYFMLGL